MDSAPKMQSTQYVECAYSSTLLCTKAAIEMNSEYKYTQKLLVKIRAVERLIFLITLITRLIILIAR